MAPSSLNRYRPAILILTVTSAAYAVYLIRRHYLDVSTTAQTGLRRRNAVRHGRRRRREPIRTATDHAIASLLAREESDQDYGTLSASEIVGIDFGSEVNQSWHLLPARIPTIELIAPPVSSSLENYQSFHQQICFELLRRFIDEEYPPDHIIDPNEFQVFRESFSDLGIDPTAIERALSNNHHRLSQRIAAIQSGQAPQSLGLPAWADVAAHGSESGIAVRALEDRETVAEGESEQSDQHSSDDRQGDADKQDVLQLVYLISEEQAKKKAYIHRGVMCNGCQTQPILGIRYSCANCPDFDLCEDCEAGQIHIKTHLFFKIRIPAPLLGYPRPAAPTWYPGKPHSLPGTLPNPLLVRLQTETKFEKVEVEALWEQFTCLASHPWPKDPSKLGMSIDRDVFAKCFAPPTSLNSPPPNLIFERIFAFYDTNNDGIIGFEEFIKGMANLQNRTRNASLRRIFGAYDMDSDGYVDRKDFLRLFRAYYSWSKEMAKVSIAVPDDEENIDLVEREEARDTTRSIIEGSRPISSAFEGSIPNGHASRARYGKFLDSNGDYVTLDDRGVLEEESDERGDRNEAMSAAALIPHLPAASSHGLDGAENTDNVTGQDLDLRSADNDRILTDMQNTAIVREGLIQERWRRRDFYTAVEEGAAAPPGYVSTDSSDDEADAVDAVDAITSPESASDSRRQSLRSRSSSKVRFEDDVTDTDYETRSNTSSRSIPVGERWGGFEIREAEKDVGKEFLYQAVQEGFNELLNQLFLDKEDLAMAAASTRAARHRWASKVQKELGVEQEASLQQQKQDIQNHRWLMQTNPAYTQHISARYSRLYQGYFYRLTQDAGGDAAKIPPSLLQAAKTTALQIAIKQFREAMHHNINVLQQDQPFPTPDPTLPQNRPDTAPQSDCDVGKSESPDSESTTSRTARTDALDSFSAHFELGESQSHTYQPHHPFPPITDEGPSLETLRLWTMHDKADAEASERHGGGKLNFDEFAERMIDDNARVEAQNDGVEKTWGASAGMGKLGFVGSWIESASF